MQVLLILSLLFAASAWQNPEQPKPPAIEKPDKPSSPEEKDPSPAGDMYRTMQLRVRIETDTAEFIKLRDSAVKIRALAEEMVHQIEASNAKRLAEPRSLREIEKLAKDVIFRSGGTKVAEDEKEFPKELDPACRLLVQYATNLAAGANKGSRFVLSADVVKYSNSILSLVRYIKKAF